MFEKLKEKPLAAEANVRIESRGNMISLMKIDSILAPHTIFIYIYNNNNNKNYYYYIY